MRVGSAVRVRVRVRVKGAFAIPAGTLGIVTRIPHHGQEPPEGVRVAFRGGTLSTITLDRAYPHDDIFLFFDEFDEIEGVGTSRRRS